MATNPKKIKTISSTDHVMRFNHYSGYQLNVTHIFIDGVYVESTTIDNHSWSKKSTFKEDIESHILEPLFNGSNYSFRKSYTNDTSNKSREDGCYIFEYIISTNKEKTTYEKIKEKFNIGKLSRSYYHNHGIMDIQKNCIKSTCVEIGGSYIREPEFNEIMREQGKSLVEHIEKLYGVKISISKFPGYRERGSGGFGFDTVEFGYEIKKIIDDSKLKVEYSEIDFIEKMKNMVNKSNDDRKLDIKNLKPGKFILENTIKQAIFSMARNPAKMYVIKNNEKELLKDPIAFKKLLLRAMYYESSFITLNAPMLLNLKKLVPALYEKLFNDMPSGLIPVLLHSQKSGILPGYSNEIKDIEEIYEKLILPEIK